MQFNTVFLLNRLYTFDINQREVLDSISTCIHTCIHTYIHTCIHPYHVSCHMKWRSFVHIYQHRVTKQSDSL